jgi:hypothetical protein
MRHLLTGILLSAIIVACSSSDPIDSDAFVNELATADQVDLCEDFLDGYCSTANGDGFCDDACIDTGCIAAVENELIDDECFEVFVSEVDDCAFTGADADCGIGAGGCIIDALEAQCP